MIYLIDGHNVIGQLPDISLQDPNDEARLVQKLIGFTARTRHRCVVVFDYGLPGGTSRMSTRSVQVVFASQRSTADRVMIERIGKIPDPVQWTVVSSDNDVLGAARGRRMQTMRSGDFAVLLQAPPAPDIDAGEFSNVNLTPEEVEDWLRFFGHDNGKTRLLHPEKSPQVKGKSPSVLPPERRTKLSVDEKSQRGKLARNDIDEWMRFFGMQDEPDPPQPLPDRPSGRQDTAPRKPTKEPLNPPPRHNLPKLVEKPDTRDTAIVQVGGGEYGEIVGKLLLRIGLFAEQQKLGRVTAPGTTYILNAKTQRTVMPAVAFVTLARAPKGLPKGHIPFAPDLAVELISNDDSSRRVLERVEQYLDAGTRLVWVVYPEERVVDVWRPGERGSLNKQKVALDGALEGEDVLPGFRLAVRGIFPK